MFLVVHNACNFQYKENLWLQTVYLTSSVLSKEVNGDTPLTDNLSTSTNDAYLLHSLFTFHAVTSCVYA